LEAILDDFNLLGTAKDHWKPPVYRNNTQNLWDRLKVGFYSFFDFQYSTIHRDLSKQLPHVVGNVLDVGCGLQPYRHLLPLNIKYAGIDISESENRFGYQTPDTIYYSGKTWPVKSKSMDFILCTETLEHVATPDIFLKEAFRALKPGGRILLTVPFAARWHFIPYDYWRYTPSGLDLLLTQAGFFNNRIYARGNQLTVVCYKIITFIFSLLTPQKSNFVFENICRLVGFFSLPIFITFAVIGNLTKGKSGIVDCLGFTVLADRPKVQPNEKSIHAKN
jgi:SAM-dependent methyltransferase